MKAVSLKSVILKEMKLYHGLLHDKEYILSETRPADGYVTADEIHFMVKKNSKKVVASSDAENASSEAETASTEATTETATSEVVYGDDSIVAIKNAEGVFEDKEDAKVIMYDDVTNIKLLKIAGDNGQGLGGAKFVVLDKKGNEIMRFTTGDEGFDIVGKLAVGETYTFKEISAPEGYKIAKPVKYTVEDTSKLQTIKIEDEKIPDRPHVPQTGKGIPLELLIFILIGVAGIKTILKKRA